MNTQYFTTNNNQKFPLSTEALAFIQEQIKLAYGLTDLAGANIIVREPTASKDGLVIYDGELLPLIGTAPTTAAAALHTAISIAEHTETMSVEGKYEGNVRTTRVASYVKSRNSQIVRPGQQRKMLSAFTKLKSISTLMAELDEAKQHVMPKGSVIAWSGTCDCDHVPYGFIPCGGFFGGSASQFAPNGAGVVEQNKWKAKYPSIKISSQSVNGIVGVIITECNGLTIPDLTDRFVVQAGMSYVKGDIGGENRHTLTVSEMPSHNHGYSSYPIDTDKISNLGENEKERIYRGDSTTKYTNYSGGGSAHENRPPYYALCYLIKVI